MQISKLLELPNAVAAKAPAPVLLLEDHRPKVKTKKAVFPKENAASLEFPTDRWGCCRALKTEVIKASARCAGHPDKMILLRDTLVELMLHIDDRDAAAMHRRSTLCAS